MTANFTKALGFTLGFEGGYSNDPNDSGGATMHGVTQKVYDHFRVLRGFTPQDVRLITDDEVSDIYYNEYWLVNRCDVLPDKMDIAVFDFSVNAGTEAKFELQKVVGVKADGIIGERTIAATITACEKSPDDTVNLYLNAHEAFYKDLCVKKPKDVRFLNGWINRTERLRTLLT